MIDLSKLRELEANNKITLRPSPDGKLLIANYTPEVQYSREWDDITKLCRGLIVDLEGNIVARPFPKFFNYEEHKEDEIPKTSFEVYEKMDGSLGILYFYNDKWNIATRGSFESEQAVKATELLSKYERYLPILKKDYTYLFEIIYPDNRIVIDYGNQEKLVALGAIHKVTGKELHLFDIGWADKATMYPGLQSATYNEIKNLDHNGEGFVLRWKSGFRVKVKMEEYVRLHSILTNVSNKTIWEYLREGKSLHEILDNVPDEFYNWVKDTAAKLVEESFKIHAQVTADYSKLDAQGFKTQKEFALANLKESKYPNLVFAFQKGIDIAPKVWDMIRPKYQKPFVNEEA